MGLLELEDNYEDFFIMLPQEWQEVIRPVWKDYINTASIYVLMDGKNIVAGGIVFRAPPPNRTDFEMGIGEKYLSKGYHYIGFLFVHPDHRNESLGSRWLSALKTQFPDRAFWLTIEEEALKSFYMKNGFVPVSNSSGADTPEWMFIYEPG